MIALIRGVCMGRRLRLRRRGFALQVCADGCVYFAFVLFAALALAGCTPHVGDKCVLSTDCSVSGTLVCDTSQLNGYCTQLNCARLSCPSNTSCIMFQASVPGCGYDDYQAPSRTGRTFCMENCNQDSDCRAGYVCRNPSSAPWNAAILDDNQSQGVCISSPAAAPASAPNASAAVCQPYDADGGIEARGASSDAGVDSGSDSPDAMSEPTDGGSDAPDAG